MTPAKYATSANDKIPLQKLEGVIERITFQNEDNGFTVAKICPQGKNYEVIVVGALGGLAVGESVKLQGVWSTHAEYGRQFEVHTYAVYLPATVEGIRKYLGSGLIHGVGPVTAQHIVDTFGAQTLEMIENQPHRLREVPGIGAKRVNSIGRAWQEQKQIKEIMLFLQSHGVSASLAIKIYKHYTTAALEVVQHEPYRLAQDIYGIGFKTADKIAQALGIPHDAPQRIRAGLQHVLGTFSNDGHCYATREQLISKSHELLEVSAESCLIEITALIGSQELIAEDDAVYLPPFYYAEDSVARKLRQLQNSEAGQADRLPQFGGVDWARAFAWLETQSALTLAESQKDAIRMALTNKVSILTGGPGTGKTTIVSSLIRLLQAKQGSVLLAAPTGRAAKRLSETTGLEAKTIHRLLEFSPTAGNKFMRDRSNPLDADLVIIDEASMIDILLMNNLLKAIENGVHLLMVGDVDQLPSVGAGNVLRDMIASEVIPVTRLTVIFRQAAESAIIVNAHRINQGKYPQTSNQISDFFIFSEPDPEKAADLILDLVARRIPAKFDFDPQEQIQVLCPMHRGQAGVAELNHRLQERLNAPRPGKLELTHGQRSLRQGDRIMQIRNNYDKKVFNGDMGKIAQIDLEEQMVTVNFDGILVDYEYSQLDELTHAYAISIHKSQGSEFPVVVIPLLTQHYMMLQRNLLYTGVTRARRLVVLVGSPKAVSMAVTNNRIAQRNTRLAQRLLDWKSPQNSGYAARKRT